MTECRHGLSEDCPACMQATIDALAKALEAAADILGDARSGYIGGSSYDEAWDARRADLFKDIQTLVGGVK